MQIRPFAELEAFARQEYAKRYASVPEPKVLNVDALVAFTAPREFVWGGVGYRAPPLAFMAGIRLLVAANALRDLRATAVSPATMQAALHRAASLIAGVVHPVSRFRRLARFRFWLPARPDLSGSFQEIEGLARWLTAVRDAALAIPSTARLTIDFVDAFAGFVRAFPAWVGKDGYPLSWAHYVYGSRHLARARAREDLRVGVATRMAATPKKDFEDWANEEKQVAGW